jgi:hypothetical protein
MEPRIAASQLVILQDVAERILSELPTYEEYHLVYALLLCNKLFPERVIPLLPTYLAHERDSVCCTAMNLLDATPDDYLTDQIAESARLVRDAHSERAFLADVVDRLEKRHRRHRD